VSLSEWMSTCATVLASGAAIMSWRAARNSSASARHLTQIEADRRHAALIPEIKAQIVRQRSGDTVLQFELVGPREVLQLDKVVIRTRPEGVDWTEKTPEKHRDEIGDFAWGPAQFRQGIDGNPSRVASCVFDDVVQSTLLQTSVEKSTAPSWWDRNMWDSRYEEHPMRLVFECVRGTDVWHVHINVSAATLYRSAGGRIL